MKYRKRPVIIEAIQWSGINLEEIKEFVGDKLEYNISDAAWKVGEGNPQVSMKIKTLEGDHIVTVGDYIIKGVEGEFYPCKPDIFNASYELVDDISSLVEEGSTDTEDILLRGTAEFKKLGNDMFWDFSIYDTECNEFYHLKWVGYDDDYWWDNISEQSSIIEYNGKRFKLDYKTLEVIEVR